MSYVRFGSKADMCSAKPYVRFIPNSDCKSGHLQCDADSTKAMADRRMRKKPQIFHAIMVVTRAEEWWVEARTIEEAKVLLQSGQGHRSSSGETVNVELERLVSD